MKEGEIIEKGYIKIPDRPGIGVEMNDEVGPKIANKGYPLVRAERLKSLRG